MAKYGMPIFKKTHSSFMLFITLTFSTPAFNSVPEIAGKAQKKKDRINWHVLYPVKNN